MRRTTVINVILLWATWAAVALGAWLLTGHEPLGAGPGSARANLVPGILAFGAGGVSGPFLARIVLYQGLAHLGPSRLAAGKALAPAIAAGLAAAVLGEAVSANLAGAIALIGVGTVLTVGDAGGLVRV